MRFLNWFTSRRGGGRPVAEVDEAGNVFNYIAPDRCGFAPVTFCQANTLHLARTVGEVLFPIDAIAERASSVPYVVRDAEGAPVPDGKLGENLRRLLRRPNPYGDLSTLVYELLFTKLATGTAWLYRKHAGAFDTTRWIDAVYCLDPCRFEPVWRSPLPGYFDVTDYSDAITGVGDGRDFVRVEDMVIATSDPDPLEYGVRGSSPLHGVRRNIELVLDVYNARRNVYANNGIAGIICKEAEKGGEGVFGVGGDTTSKRKEIVDDLQQQYSLRGLSSIKALSTMPLRFVKTLATISELEPFKETYQDALAIAAAYQVPKHLIPTETQVTYDNQRASEVAFWQNVVLPYAEEAGRLLGEALRLQEGWRLAPDPTGVPVLQTDRTAELATEKQEIENLQLLREVLPERAAEINAALASIVERYRQ